LHVKLPQQQQKSRTTNAMERAKRMRQVPATIGLIFQCFYVAFARYILQKGNYCYMHRVFVTGFSRERRMIHRFRSSPTKATTAYIYILDPHGEKLHRTTKQQQQTSRRRLSLHPPCAFLPCLFVCFFRPSRAWGSSRNRDCGRRRCRRLRCCWNVSHHGRRPYRPAHYCWEEEDGVARGCSR
jgi:hypothetical protein